MLNNTGITKVSAVAPNQILMFTDPQVGVSILASNSGIDAGTDGKKIIKAGTPMAGDLTVRGTAFTKAATTDSGTKGVYTVQITTAATAGDKITIEGTDYECAAEEDVAGKKFAGATAAAQVTSLLKMVVCDDFVVSADSATDKIKFTQKVAETGNAPTASATPVASTGTLVIGDVTTVTAGSTGTVSNNAVGVLLHDVDVTAGNNNATLLIFGFVDLDKLDTATANLIDSAAKAALKGSVTFLK